MYQAKHNTLPRVSEAVDVGRVIVCVDTEKTALVIHVTRRYLLTGDSQPLCDECKSFLTVKHVMRRLASSTVMPRLAVDCCDLSETLTATCRREQRKLVSRWQLDQSDHLYY